MVLCDWLNELKNTQVKLVFGVETNFSVNYVLLFEIFERNFAFSAPVS